MTRPSGDDLLTSRNPTLPEHQRFFSGWRQHVNAASSPRFPWTWFGSTRFRGYGTESPCPSGSGIFRLPFPESLRLIECQASNFFLAISSENKIKQYVRVTWRSGLRERSAQTGPILPNRPWQAKILTLKKSFLRKGCRIAALASCQAKYKSPWRTGLESGRWERKLRRLGGVDVCYSEAERFLWLDFLGPQDWWITECFPNGGIN